MSQVKTIKESSVELKISVEIESSEYEKFLMMNYQTC